MKAKLVKLEMTLEDEQGHRWIQSLEGDEAQRWHQWVSGYVEIGQIRQGRSDGVEFQWQKRDA